MADDAKKEQTPADMGFTQEVIDILHKAEVKVEDVAAAVKKTGKEAVTAIARIIKAVWDK